MLQFSRQSLFPSLPDSVPVCCIFFSPLGPSSSGSWPLLPALILPPCLGLNSSWDDFHRTRRERPGSVVSVRFSCCHLKIFSAPNTLPTSFATWSFHFSAILIEFIKWKAVSIFCLSVNSCRWKPVSFLSHRIKGLNFSHSSLWYHGDFSITPTRNSMKCVKGSESVLVVRFWSIVILLMSCLHLGALLLWFPFLSRFWGPIASQ
jgi:hypothetical protein